MKQTVAALLALLLSAGAFPAEAAYLATHLRSEAAPPIDAALLPAALTPSGASDFPVPLTSPLTIDPALTTETPLSITPRDVSASQVLMEISSSKEPAQVTALRLDGAKPQKTQELTSGSETPTAPSGLSPASDPTPPAPKRGLIDFLRRLNKASGAQSKTESWLLRFIALGIALAVAFPILYKILPVHTAPRMLIAATALPVLVYGSMTIARAVRFLIGRTPKSKPQTPPRLMRISILGLALGLALGAGPVAYKAPIIERVADIIKPSMELKRVQGSALKDEVIKILSQNPVGRDVLDSLRDRGGKIRIPDFFVSKQEEPMAEAMFLMDIIAISKQEIVNRGWTVEQFVRDPKLQLQFAVQFQTTFVHELRHAGQARRSILHPEPTGHIQGEYEAFMTEHFYIFEQLKADPHAKFGDEDFENLVEALQDLEAYLSRLASTKFYDKDTQIHTPYYDAYLANLRAGWPAHQVEGWTLMARRSLPQFPKTAANYISQANAAAKKAGLPPVALP